MNNLLLLASASETLTGVILLVYPPIVSRLLFSSETPDDGDMTSRIAGMSLIAFGVVCWPGSEACRAFCGMLAYCSLAMAYLVGVGLKSRAGFLLWPAIAVHTGLFVLLLRTWRKEREADPEEE